MKVTFTDRNLDKTYRVQISKGIDKYLAENNIDKKLDFTINIVNEGEYIKSVTYFSEDKTLQSLVSNVIVQNFNSIF